MVALYMPWSIFYYNNFRYLLENIDWLEDDLGQFDNEFILVDCPGQLELYTHFTIFKDIISVFQRMGYQVCCIYLLEAIFLQDISKFFSGVLSAMSSMVQLEIPHLNVITKLDLLDSDTLESDELERYLLLVIISFRYFSPDPNLLLDWLKTDNTLSPGNIGMNPKFRKLNETIVGLVPLLLKYFFLD